MTTTLLFLISQKYPPPQNVAYFANPIPHTSFQVPTVSGGRVAAISQISVFAITERRHLESTPVLVASSGVNFTALVRRKSVSWFEI
jgi:hypothetical protein